MQLLWEEVGFYKILYLKDQNSHPQGQYVWQMIKCQKTLIILILKIILITMEVKMFNNNLLETD